MFELDLSKVKPYIQILVNNPDMSYEEFKELTGFRENMFRVAKKQAKKIIKVLSANDRSNFDDEKIAMKIEMKAKLMAEIRQRMKEKYGFVNLK